MIKNYKKQTKNSYKNLISKNQTNCLLLLIKSHIHYYSVMKSKILLSIILVFSIICICNGQLIMGTPLGRQFDEYQKAQDQVSDQELLQIEEEIEDTLLKSEGVLEDLYNKNNDETLSDDEMLYALKESVKKIHDKQEEESKKNIADDVKLTTNIIGESTLDEIQDDLNEGYFFHPYAKNGSKSQSQKQRQKSAKQKKKEIQELIAKEKQWFQQTRNQLKNSGENELIIQTQFSDKAAQNKKKYDSFVEAQRKTLEKIEANLNKLQTKNQLEDNTTTLKETYDTGFLQDTIDSIFETSQGQDQLEPIVLNQENELKIISEEGEQLKNLKEEYEDSETLKQLEKEIQDLMQVGDQMHEKFLDEQEMIQEILENSEPVEQQEPEEPGVYEVDDDKQLMEKEEYLEDQINQVNEQSKEQNQEIIQKVEQNKKEEEQEEQSRLYKEVAFAIVIIMAIIFLIFGSQIDVFSYFSHGRRAKDPFYRDDEAQQSLIN
ncbi:transmembrane protein, putative (macronuclear) [Tetrahymena thermophila SB210]|uniref:Transmembrane protein, putative n=1 Tax=Tetrahymena thermophila (strain SB210) TaxID=312017 RepID=Q23MP7_TETTS|nr:transmembrane protein, putative [Tetrahymena thermophila SB210]EAR97795.4 transmembrane protein, putative [Tetrahymena thermophila SB210]|eukprot:XP_001018040.4 transmembrane protein, putative [Tetrahymena thermophila SB210]